MDRRSFLKLALKSGALLTAAAVMPMAAVKSFAMESKVRDAPIRMRFPYMMSLDEPENVYIDYEDGTVEYTVLIDGRQVKAGDGVEMRVVGDRVIPRVLGGERI